MLRLYLCGIALAALVLTGCQTTRAPDSPAQLEASSWVRVDPPGAGHSKDLPSEAPPPRSGELSIQTLGSEIPHLGSAPVAFTSPSSTVVVEDRAGQSDSYRDGSVTIPITMHRVIPDVQKAISLGTLSPTARVSFWVYDIDSNGSPCAELDVAYLNGQRLGDLSGANGTWTRHEFEVTTSTLRFPSAPGSTTTNTFRMDVDVNGCNAWLAEVDYVQITFEAADPIVFVHGILSGAERWQELNNELTSQGYVTSNTINLDYEEFPADDLTSPDSCREEQFQSVGRNVEQLREQVQAALSGLGAERVHIVAHSKGGMDTRAFISSLKEDELLSRVGTVGGAPVEGRVEVVSLTTLNTPHAGSPVADLGVAYALSENGQTVDEELLDTLLESDGGFVRGLVVDMLMSANHVCDLTQNRARYYSHENPVTVPILATGTDADPDGDRELEAGDITGFTSGGWTDWAELQRARGVVNQLYTSTGNTAALSYEEVRVEGKDVYFVTAVGNDNDEFNDNDVVVTETSASDDGSFTLSINDDGINHNEIGVNEDTIDDLINLATGSVLDWSERQ